MGVFSAIDYNHHEQVVFCSDKESGLKAIIAIHSTKLGPALGGCRMWNYASEQEAVTDVLRLSRGMTYKASIANLQLGGGKAVIIGDPKTMKTPELFHKFGEFIELLNGRYITAEDVGTSVQDMGLIPETTAHVVGLDKAHGGSGDPSPFTALGLYHSIRAAVAYKLQQRSLEGITIAVQGLGHVGSQVCRLLHEEGAKLILTDLDKRLATEMGQVYGAHVVDSDEIYSVDAEVFVPCALGAVINDFTIPQMHFEVISGAANNQLERRDHGEMLYERGILYAPDYVVNAGGLINVYYEGPDYDVERVRRHVEGLHDTLLVVFRKSEELGISTSEAADRLAQERLQSHEGGHADTRNQNSE